jgi:hypothetical protein
MAGTVLTRLAANLVLLAHFLVVLFAVFGAIGVLVHPAWALLHLPAVLWSAMVNLAGWTCPLTPLENRFRIAGYGAGYEGGFLHHCIGPLVYPRGMPRQLELVAGVSILVWNGVLYGGILSWLGREAAA